MTVGDWQWPPGNRPSAPISPTMLETARDCALQACFRASGYPVPPTIYLEVGKIVHHVLEELRNEIAGLPKDTEPAAVRRRAVELFDADLVSAKSAIKGYPRPRPIRWDERRVHDARLGVIEAADAMFHAFRVRDPTIPGGIGVAEQTIVSADGSMAGTPDLVTGEDHGVTIIDFKTGQIPDDQADDRYARQIHFYAFLWHDKTGEWPLRGMLRNPVTGESREIEISAIAAESLAQEAGSLLERYRYTGDVGDLADVGDYCCRCPYLIWCDPYWAQDETDCGHAAGGEVLEAEVSPVGEHQVRGWIRLSQVARPIGIYGATTTVAALHVGKSIRVAGMFVAEDGQATITAHTDILPS